MNAPCNATITQDDGPRWVCIQYRCDGRHHYFVVDKDA